MITEEQRAALEGPLNRSHVKQRVQAGRKLDYVEGWHAIAEANRIFGFDGWTRETVEMKEARQPELVDGKWRVGYIAKVKVTALGITREGTGYGSGIAKDLGDAYESAVKEAETDAMKRALMTFGNPFGLALYDKTQASVVSAPTEPKPSAPKNDDSRAVYTEIEKDIRSADSVDALKDVWTAIDWDRLPQSWFGNLEAEKNARYRELKAPNIGAPAGADPKSHLDRLPQSDAA